MNVIFLHRGLILFGLLACLACNNTVTNDIGEEEALPLPTPAALILKDVAYAKASSAQKLDLFVPEGNGPFPLVVYVHGGGWRNGDKESPKIQAITTLLLGEGYAVASLNYRLSGEAKFPAAAQDIKTALRWLRAHAQENRVDPDRFGAWGDSAGGHLVSLLGTSCGAAELEGADLGDAEQSSCVRAVVDWYGPIDFLQMDQQYIDSGSSCPANHDSPNSGESQFLGGPIQDYPELVAAANPITYISADDADFFIQHGTADCTVPPQQSQIFYDALKAVVGEARVSLNYLQDAGHGDKLFVTPSNLDLVVEFLNQRLK